ncbi:Dyp-type peroxidase [Stenotrophomonas acidaminiphila]
MTTTAQPVTAGLSRAAIFLVVTLRPDTQASARARAVCGDVSTLVRSIGSRVLDGGLCCVTGVGSEAWDRLYGAPRPKELHPFIEIDGRHRAVATPGDLLFHIRAGRMDLCFELATQLMTRLGDAVASADQVNGFGYFDSRDLIGFVDGTENPVDDEAREAALVGADDPGFAGGSYVVTQKYLHDLQGWNAVPVAEQERIVGRTKLDNIELDDDAKPSYAHNALTNIVEAGRELKILRSNMSFGDAARGEYGTFFIGYACTPTRIEKMLRNMFIGNPPGNHDRLLDFSRTVSGNLFFAPPAGFLEDAAG